MQKLPYFIIVFLFCCCSHYPDSIEDVLRQAGKNRSELEKVLKHYAKNPADSLKLRAAEFLIVNMPGKYSEFYDAPWDDVASVYLRWTSSSDKKKVVDKYQLGEKLKKDDVTNITADYLINNIELAFKVWVETPWGKDVPFDIFCEDILPYRLNTEPLENWREKALASFADLYRTFLDQPVSAVEACRRLNELLPHFRYDTDFPRMNFSQLMATTRGSCEEESALAIFAMRALGIPVTLEFTPKWIFKDAGHEWNSVRSNNGNYISFSGKINPGQPHMGTTYPKYKVYRNMFGNSYKINADDTDIPPLLQNRNLKDVTSEYGNCVDIEVPMVFHSPKSNGYAYLSVPYGIKKWLPIAWGTTHQQKINFQSVGKGNLYMPVYYYDHEQISANYPFWLDNNGVCKFFKPDTSKNELLELTRINQSEFQKSLIIFAERMIKGRFEGANRSDFSDVKLLYTIQDVKGTFYHSADIGHTSKYRYVRYFSPAKGHCNVAELEFYDENGNILRGIPIGTSTIDPMISFDKVFDGDISTYFDTEAPDNGWVGLDLGEPSVISKIRFLPRNDGSSIYEGHTYILFYWNGRQWFPIDTQIATAYHLHFIVPSNALFYLHNFTQNHAGQFFTTQNGVVKWINFGFM